MNIHILTLKTYHKSILPRKKGLKFNVTYCEMLDMSVCIGTCSTAFVTSNIYSTVSIKHSAVINDSAILETEKKNFW